jgi:pilus assembly protein Flp/PilA
MTKFFASISNELFELRSREDGQAMAEYGIILALVAVAVIVVLGLLGTDIRNAFQNVVNAI